MAQSISAAVAMEMSWRPTGCFRFRRKERSTGYLSLAAPFELRLQLPVTEQFTSVQRTGGFTQSARAEEPTGRSILEDRSCLLPLSEWMGQFTSARFPIISMLYSR